MFPETQNSTTKGEIKFIDDIQNHNLIDAVFNGASNGIKIKIIIRW
jgi:nucleoside permease NupC